MQFTEIKKWLIDKNLTQAEIARKAGVSQTAVHLVLRGRSVSSKIVKILEELGCPAGLLGRKAA